ncbi:flavodoxin domain-containing protein [Egicoccus sp. AB-alg6-2]|uniref:flavodoxin domain-containing protein n=1 Tax=Egicoccus sp. AB-alg6-2 TaxID=3242692 RepID=UPI00359D6511
MRVLVAVASRHGATHEIAAALGERLAGHGLRVVVADAEVVDDLERYDAVVLGSAVYAGHWLESARDLVERLRDPLMQRPLWLFSSGPVGTPPKPVEEALEPQRLARELGARAHRVFAGRIDRDRLTFGERALVRALRAPVGDFRNWADVASWADEIHAALVAAPAV